MHLRYSFGRSSEGKEFGGGTRAEWLYGVLRRGFAEFTPSEGVAEEGILLTPSEGVKKKLLSWEVRDGTTAVRG